MEDKRQRYECECTCGFTFYACKSLFQQWGLIDSGSGSCPKCKVFYNLTLDEENKKMILTEWEKHMKNRKEKLGGNL